MKTQLNKLSKILKEEFAPVYSDMTGQFPVEELKTYEHFLKYFDNDNYCFYMADDIGYILFANIDNYIWVDYLAVFEKYRSMGFGSKILDLIKKEFKNYNGIFFEVEKVDENKINTIKRKNFYIKNDVYPIDNIEYYYPNNEGGLLMDLYYHGINNKNPDKDIIKKVIYDVFKTIHFDLDDVDKIYSKIKFKGE